MDQPRQQDRSHLPEEPREPRLPPGPPLPGPVQALAFILAQRQAFAWLRRRYGSTLSARLPFGAGVVISDPALIRELFTTSPSIAGNMEPNLGRVMGPGSIFSLDGEPHRVRRRMLAPPFHGRRMQAFTAVIEEEALKEFATWPEGVEFPTQDSFMRITLNVILRAVFGAEGSELEELRDVMPQAVAIGQRLVFLPVGPEGLGPWKPWSRFHEVRARYDAIAGRLIARAAADPDLAARDDVLAMLVQARSEDGGAMTPAEIADELTSLLAAGHETTATTLAWAVERLRRHPDVLRRLVAEVDAGGGDLLDATLTEVQRDRPVITATARNVVAPFLHLGEWSIPRGTRVIVDIDGVHHDERLYPRASRFDPDRFVGVRPDTSAWIPFGGGTRRCVGAAFATLEMAVVLRLLLREFEVLPTRARGERQRSRGVAYGPARGGRVVVRRRRSGVRLDLPPEQALTGCAQYGAQRDR